MGAYFVSSYFNHNIFVLSAYTSTTQTPRTPITSLLANPVYDNLGSRGFARRSRKVPQESRGVNKHKDVRSALTFH